MRPSLRDGGITWVFYFRESEVPTRELAMVGYAEHEQFLRIAVTFRRRDAGADAYQSTTVVHLWRMGLLPPEVSWKTIFVHIFIHEPLHHLIGRLLAELDDDGDQEWVIRELGDGRWW